MIITVMVLRDPAQRVRATARVSVAGKDVRCLATVTWDPSGPLTAADALEEACLRLGRQLYRDRQQEGSQELREGARESIH
jgi:hypothetical protein